METLNSETFKSVQELAEIQKQIAIARAEFETLRSTKDTFLAQIEKDTLVIVDNVLTASKEAIATAEGNKNAVASLLAVVTDCVQEALTMQKDLNETAITFETNINKTKLAFAEKTKELEAQTAVLKQRQRQIEDDERSIEIARASIMRDRIMLADRKKMLETEITRIKNNHK